MNLLAVFMTVGIFYPPNNYCGKSAVFNSKTKTIDEYSDISSDFFTPDPAGNHFESFESVPEDQLPLAVIDMSEASSYPHKVASQIINALETVGFMYVKNIPGFDDEKLLQLTQQFFELPASHKWNVTRRNWNNNSNQLYHGYFPVIPEWTSYKEGYEIGYFEGTIKNRSTSGHTLRDTLQEPNVWPNLSCPQETQYFKMSMIEYFNIYNKLSQNISMLLALGLGLDESTIASKFQVNPLSTVRILHYPPRPSHHIPPEALDGDTILHFDKHADSGFLALLSTFNYRGLQILDDNQWINIPPLKNTIIVNIGLNLAAISGGKFKATVHRVVDLRKSRYSVAFFMEPQYDEIVSKTLWGTQIEGMEENLKYGPWVMNNTSQYAENAETNWGTVS